MEVKRSKLNATLISVQEPSSDHSKRNQNLKNQIDRLESENRDLNKRLEEMTQKCHFYQKENLQLDVKRVQAEKKIQSCHSEMARLTDDLQEKEFGLKYLFHPFCIPC